MPNLKPTTRIDVIGNLDLSPEKDPGFFIESKQQKKFFIKAPNWDTPGADNIDLLAIQSEREHQQMIQLHADMLKNAKLQSKINSERVKELYQSTSELRQRLIKVNSFMKECDDKKQVAEQKVAEELQKQDEMKKSIEQYKESSKHLIEFRDTLSEAIKDFEPYEKVIKEVIAKTDGWSSVKECTDRCDALKLAHAEISKMEKDKIQEIEAMRQEMTKVTSEASLTMLGFINQMSQMERDYDKARSECLKWEKVLANIKQSILDDKLNKQRMFDGIQLMYKDLCRRRGIDPIIKRNDVEKQLDFIKDEIEILKKVVEKCKKK